MSYYPQGMSQGMPQGMSQGMRRSYEPQAPSAAARAGVGLLFQTSGGGQIVVKEVVKGGSAARSGQIKPTDIIVRVGHTSVQNQSLVNLRELILGEPGTYVVLGFSRGGTQQFYEVSLMRGSPDYLDQHQNTAKPAPKATETSAPTSAPTLPSSSGTGGNMYNSAGAGSTSASTRETDEIERLRAALSASQAEVSRLRASLRSQELLVERNGEELRTYREALEKSQDEQRQGQSKDDRHRQELLGNFKRTYDRERARLSTALEKSQSLTRSISQVLPTIQGMERELNKDPNNKGFY
mmetsp:Transcript_2473/g.5956  ORF Transcript_2473/g.5956 Transcript_2473/m.5956 type:complete len:296 (+) Transcript_2473:54-941(+)|eukprot:CAMPEP_0206241000 /NCGR_PEP_ID=MMETSP0047_2-20121206/16258_1 /ASSEMBLY_ACC=CAM_ASM_000192 /TAXON_ID=195065 /ORGANISM="Chroomonas mesostigmatica_cf, Strain CCMP1168" /LENGTH=295 /DNA_ID=CAMNT_0053665859 /DNA_START=12 /DNA_END=899 /DNA_ORIENTATION=-